MSFFLKTFLFRISFVKIQIILIYSQFCVAFSEFCRLFFLRVNFWKIYLPYYIFFLVLWHLLIGSKAGTGSDQKGSDPDLQLLLVPLKSGCICKILTSLRIPDLRTIPHQQQKNYANASDWSSADSKHFNCDNNQRASFCSLKKL